MSIACSSSSSSHSRPARAPVAHLRQAARLLDELARRAPLRAQRALVDRRARVALDVDQLAAARVDELPAPDRAVGAHRLGDLQAGDARAGRAVVGRHGARAHAPVERAAEERDSPHAFEGGRASHRRIVPPRAPVTTRLRPPPSRSAASSSAAPRGATGRRRGPSERGAAAGPSPRSRSTRGGPAPRVGRAG